MVRQVPIAELVVDLAALGRPFLFTAHGGSMSPTIVSGSILTIEPCVPAVLRAGDIAMAIDDERGRVLVHRVVERAEGLLLWGDGMAAPDGPLGSFRVVGRVIDMSTPTLVTRARARWEAIRRRFARLRSHG